MSDIVAAVRSLRRMPVLVGGAIATLAVAVGLNIAVFGLIHRALLSAPDHVVEPERVFTLGFSASDDPASESMTSTSYVAFRAIKDDVRELAGAAAFQRTTSTLILEGDQKNVNTMLVSGLYFTLLGVRPSHGRTLGPLDDDAGALPPLAVVSHSFWRNTLQQDAAVIGRRLRVGGIEYEVAGVTPEGFSGHSTAAVDVFLPFAVAMRDSPGWDRQSFRNVAGVLVRLGPGQSPLAAATQAGAAIDRRVIPTPLAGTDVSPMERRVAGWLAAVAGLVLTIGLANSAVLLLVRGIKNRREVAIRAALGASHARLRFQALVESMFIATLATLASLALAAWMDDAMRRVLFPELRSGGSVGFTAFATALSAGLIAASVAFIATLSQIPKSSEAAHLRSGAPGASRRTRGTTPLLVVQTTLAFLLLAGAGFFGASLYRLRGQDFGMDLDRVMVVDFEQTSAELPGQDAFFTEALARVASLPGVSLATTIDSTPFAGFNVPPISVPGRTEPPAAGQQLPFLTAATPEFLKILGLQVVAGRAFDASDERGAPVVIVNQTMARGVWPGETALGKCIRIGFDPDFNPETFDPSSGPPMPSSKVPCREVIGVMRDVRQRSVLPGGGEDRLMQYLVPFSQVPEPPFATNPVRIRGLLLKVKDATIAADIRRAATFGHIDLPYLRVRPYTQLLDRQLRPWTMGTRLLGLFSVLALSVSAIGMFAAFAHQVAERRREMAIRLAIGARPALVRRLVMREALGIAASGIALGLVAAVLAGRGLQSMLFGTAPADPLVLFGSSGLLLLMACLATFFPAREASRSDPNVLLRTE